MFNRRGNLFLILFFISIGFFVAQKCFAAPTIEINEVSWMGSLSNANAEWIELKNVSSVSISMSGWTMNAVDGAPKINLSGNILPGAYFLLERTSDDSVPEVAADLIYSGVLGNTGEDLVLRDSAGNMVDEISAIDGWPAGDNALKLTMEKKTDGTWQNSSLAGGTPKAKNSGSEGTIEIPNSGNDNNKISDGDIGPRFGDVVINEFVSYPNDGQNEWVELYNKSGGELSLVGWIIADASGAETKLSGGFNEDNYYFFSAEKFKGALNNSGDEIILYSETHNIIDKVVYGSYGEKPENNAPAPSKGEAAALIIDGDKKIYDIDSYKKTSTPTKNKTNIITSSSIASSSDILESEERNGLGIMITEIFPNPVGVDRDQEFIELYNSSSKEIDLAGYRLSVEGGRIFEFGKNLNLIKKMAAGEFFALKRTDSNLILDNNGGILRLYESKKTKASQVVQYSVAVEGVSYCDAEIIDNYNLNEDTKKFLQNSLMVDRWVWSALPTPNNLNQIKAINHSPRVSFSSSAKVTAGTEVLFDASDTYDEDGDKLSYNWDFNGDKIIGEEIFSHVFLKPGPFKVILTVGDGTEESVLTKIINVGGVLPAANFTASSSESANKAPAVNFLSENSEREKIVSYLANSKLENTAIVPFVKPMVQVAGIKKTGSAPVNKVGEISKLKIGSNYKISGTVIVRPGIFGSQYFFIAIATNTPAIKIYNYYHDFPVLALGDEIQVAGVVGGSQADKYLKIKSSANIKILKGGKNILPLSVNFKEINEDNLGKLVAVSGEVVGKNSPEIKIFNGQDNINLYIKPSAGIDTKNIKAGQKISATGLLQKISDKLMILPRGNFDLVVASSSEYYGGKVLGVASGSAAWTLPANSGNNKSVIYIIIVITAVISAVAVIYFRTKKNK